MNIDKSTQDQISQYQVIILSCRGKTNFPSKKISSSHNGYQIKVTNTISVWYLDEWSWKLLPHLAPHQEDACSPYHQTRWRNWINIYRNKTLSVSVNQVKKQIYQKKSPWIATQYNGLVIKYRSSVQFWFHTKLILVNGKWKLLLWFCNQTRWTGPWENCLNVQQNGCMFGLDPEKTAWARQQSQVLGFEPKISAWARPFQTN
jgi:hypothetical protein